MQGVTVGEAMTTDVDVVPLNMPLVSLAEEFGRTHHHGFPVVDDAGELVGVVSLQDLEQALAAGPVEGRTVADIATTEGVIVAYPYEPMWMALRRLGTRDVSRLPVLEREGSRRLVGAVRRSDIIRAYNQAIVKRARHQHWAEVLRLGRLDRTLFEQIEIAPGSPVVGQQIREITLPEECLIVSIRRGRQLQVVHGHTVLSAGDRVTVFANRDCLPAVYECLTSQLVELTEEEKA
jgi:CIC family chloride channel protein